MQETVLELKNYSVSFDTPDGEVQAVRNVDLTVKKGEILCIVGESGCGKTVMCRSVMKLLPPNAHVKSGEISLCGENITAYKRKKMEKLCGSKVSMVFQDPMLTLNPTIPVFSLSSRSRSRIFASTVASNAVVASSANNISGSQASAIASTQR